MKKIRFVEYQLAYEQRGKGTPLVLIHGFPLDSRIWGEVAPLLEEKFELFIPDLRGFGQSSNGIPKASMDLYALHIADILDLFQLEKAVIVGHSMGGYIALAFAHNHPERVSGLGLISTQAPADTPERKEGRYATAAQVEEQGVRVVADAMTPKLTSNPTVQAQARKIMESQQPHGVTDALKAMAERADASARLGSFQSPTVIIHGEADELIPVDRAREMKAVIPQAHFVGLKGVGHLPMMEAPVETAEALMRLL